MANGLQKTPKRRGYAEIERGGLSTVLRERHGAAEITELTRQRVDWQRGTSSNGGHPVKCA